MSPTAAIVSRVVAGGGGSGGGGGAGSGDVAGSAVGTVDSAGFSGSGGGGVAQPATSRSSKPSRLITEPDS